MHDPAVVSRLRRLLELRYPDRASGLGLLRHRPERRPIRLIRRLMPFQHFERHEKLRVVTVLDPINNVAVGMASETIVVVLVDCQRRIRVAVKRTPDLDVTAVRVAPLNAKVGCDVVAQIVLGPDLADALGDGRLHGYSRALTTQLSLTDSNSDRSTSRWSLRHRSMLNVNVVTSSQ